MNIAIFELEVNFSLSYIEYFGDKSYMITVALNDNPSFN